MQQIWQEDAFIIALKLFTVWDTVISNHTPQGYKKYIWCILIIKIGIKVENWKTLDNGRKFSFNNSEDFVLKLI